MLASGSGPTPWGRPTAAVASYTLILAPTALPPGAAETTITTQLLIWPRRNAVSSPPPPPVGPCLAREGTNPPSPPATLVDSTAAPIAYADRLLASSLATKARSACCRGRLPTDSAAVTSRFPAPGPALTSILAIVMWAWGPRRPYQADTLLEVIQYLRLQGSLPSPRLCLGAHGVHKV
jgi:hypothetical protein